MHDRSYRTVVQHKVWLEARARFALGDGGIVLLQAIGKTGSVRAGAREIGWSYRHALAYLDNAERRLGYRLVARARGGHARGGATLTPDGHDLLRRYTLFRRRLERTLQRLYHAAFSGFGR